MYRIKHFLLKYGLSLLLLIVIVVSIVVGKLILSLCLILAFVLIDFVAFVLFFKGPLNIKTPDGYDQPYHPSVVFFESGWNGWKYWMAFTPYPVGGKPYMDCWENPCVIVSQDGVYWQYPGKMAFLDELTNEQINNKNYYSDTHLIYNGDKDCLELYYRLNSGKNSDEVTIFRIISNNGIDWSDKKKLVSEGCDLYTPEPVSQSIIYHNRKYKMWYVSDTKGDSIRKIKSMESDDGLIWNNLTSITLSGYDINPWHIDCQLYNEKYYLLVYSFDKDLTLWESVSGVDFYFKKILLRPSNRPGIFYNSRPYRSCIVRGNREWSIFFSASNRKSHKLGMMLGKSLNNMRVVSCSKITKEYIKLYWKQQVERLFAIEVAIALRFHRIINRILKTR